MTSVGACVFAVGLALYGYGFIGRTLERRWDRLDPRTQHLSALGQFQLGRQRALMRQAPYLRRFGIVAIVVGPSLIVLAKL